MEPQNKEKESESQNGKSEVDNRELDIQKLMTKTPQDVFEAIRFYHQSHSKLIDAIHLLKAIVDYPDDRDITDARARKFLKEYEVDIPISQPFGEILNAFANPDESFIKDMAENNQGHSLSNENFTEEFKENEDPTDYEEEGLSEEDLKSYREYKDSDQWAVMGHDEYQRYKMLNDYE